MRKKNDGSINMGKVLSAEITFRESLGDFEDEDPVLSKLAHISAGCYTLTEFILENEEHYEYVEKTQETIEFIVSELRDIKEELKSINNPGYPVRLWFHVRSEENAHEYDWGDVPVYLLSFYKDTVLPLPPFIGLQIKNYYRNLLISNISVELSDDHGEDAQVFCYFDDEVLPKEEIERDISEIQEALERDQWHLDRESKVPGMPEDNHY